MAANERDNIRNETRGNRRMREESKVENVVGVVGNEEVLNIQRTRYEMPRMPKLRCYHARKVACETTKGGWAIVEYENLLPEISYWTILTESHDGKRKERERKEKKTAIPCSLQAKKEVGNMYFESSPLQIRHSSCFEPCCQAKTRTDRASGEKMCQGGRGSKHPLAQTCSMTLHACPCSHRATQTMLIHHHAPHHRTLISCCSTHAAQLMHLIPCFPPRHAE